MNFLMWEYIFITGIVIVSFYLGTLTYDLLKPVLIYTYKEFYKYFTWGNNRRFWEMIHGITSNKEFMAQLRKDAQFKVIFARAVEPILKGDLVFWNQIDFPSNTSPSAQYKYVNVRMD